MWVRPPSQSARCILSTTPDMVDAFQLCSWNPLRSQERKARATWTLTETTTFLEIKSYGIKLNPYPGHQSRSCLRCARVCHLYSLDDLVIVIFQGKCLTQMHHSFLKALDFP
ncbi:hypothetical protein CapIbe_013995 [Capra ibex]